jgi:hypothetical protein
MRAKTKSGGARYAPCTGCMMGQIWHDQPSPSIVNVDTMGHH